jgi:hypothetical protein
MRFFSDIPANHGVWDGRRMLEFTDGVYETRKKKEIELLKGLGYRHEEEPGEVFEAENDDDMVIIDIAAGNPHPVDPDPKPKPRKPKKSKK